MSKCENVAVRHGAAAKSWKSRALMGIGTVAALFVLALPLPAAAQTWAVWPANSTLGSTENGTLFGNPVTATAATASVQFGAIPGINPPYNSYCIWAGTGVTPAPAGAPPPVNSANLWPASAAYPACADQLLYRAYAAATSTNPFVFTISFAKPIVNPHVMVYSLDNSAIDFSGTKDIHGNPAVFTMTTGGGAVVSGASLGTSSFGGAEGCLTDPATHACAYIKLVGTYRVLSFSGYVTSGGSEGGVGMNVGADNVYVPPLAPAPALEWWPLLALLMAGLGAVGLRRPS